MKVNVICSKHNIVFYIVDAYMAFSHEVYGALLLWFHRTSNIVVGK